MSWSIHHGKCLTHTLRRFLRSIDCLMLSLNFVWVDARFAPPFSFVFLLAKKIEVILTYVFYETGMPFEQTFHITILQATSPCKPIVSWAKFGLRRHQYIFLLFSTPTFDDAWLSPCDVSTCDHPMNGIPLGQIVRISYMKCCHMYCPILLYAIYRREKLAIASRMFKHDVCNAMLDRWSSFNIY